MLRPPGLHDHQLAHHGEGLARFDVACIERGGGDQILDRRQAVLARQSDDGALVEGVGELAVALHRLVGDARRVVDPADLQQGAREQHTQPGALGARRLPFELPGQPIDPQREYRLAMTNFTASGGDGYPKIDNHPGYVNTGFVDADVLRAFIARNSPLKAADFDPGDAVQRR